MDTMTIITTLGELMRVEGDVWLSHDSLNILHKTGKISLTNHGTALISVCSNEIELAGNTEFCYEGYTRSHWRVIRFNKINKLYPNETTFSGIV